MITNMRDIVDNKLHSLRYKLVYVDPDNGDDSNDGTYYPVKTIDHAIDMAESYKHILISLAGGHTYTINYRHYVYNCEIEITCPDTTNLPTIENIVNSDNSTSGFSARNVIFTINHVNFKTAAYTSDNTTSNIWEGIFTRTGYGGYQITTYECNIEIQDTPFIHVPSGPTLVKSLSMYHGDIIRHTDGARTSSLVVLENNHPFIIYDDTSSKKDQDGNDVPLVDLISGITRDSNGVPRNILCNRAI